MRAELSLELMEAAQGSYLHGMNDRCMHSNATLLTSLCHIVENSQWAASGSVLLIIASNFHGLVAHYTLNKLDTLSNEIYAVRNPRAGYTTTALRFLNRVDPLDSVSNYYINTAGVLLSVYFRCNLCGILLRKK